MAGDKNNGNRAVKRVRTEVAAVIFDMDGVLIDSEEEWERARIAVVAQFGGTYHAGVTQDVMGMSAPEWSRYLREVVGVPLSEPQIAREVVARLMQRYRSHPPFFPGAVDSVRAISRRWPVALASASSRELIDLVLALGDVRPAFGATVSADEVGRGKPAPDVYLKAAAALGVSPALCVAIEDSSNGIRSAKNAGMRIVAIPTAAFAPSADALALADRVLPRIAELTPALIEELFSDG